MTTNETTAQVDFTLEAGWRQSLPEVFRSVAERYGQRLFNLAYAIGSVNEALRIMAPKVQNHHEFRSCIHFIAQGMNVLAGEAIAGVGTDQIRIAEVQRDIERAALLAGTTLQPEGKKLIIPS